jgi:predicted Zn-dependent protease
LRGERGLAELASAEQNYAVGNYPAALNFAERARRTLETGTVSYQRALDISNFAGAELRELRAENRGGR